MPDFEFTLVSQGNGLLLHVRDINRGAGRYLISISNNLYLYRADSADIGNAYSTDSSGQIEINYPSRSYYNEGNKIPKQVKIRIEEKSEMQHSVLCALQIRINDNIWQDLLRVYPTPNDSTYDIKFAPPFVHPLYDRYLDTVGNDVPGRIYIH